MKGAVEGQFISSVGNRQFQKIRSIYIVADEINPNRIMVKKRPISKERKKRERNLNREKLKIPQSSLQKNLALFSEPLQLVLRIIVHPSQCSQ